MGELRHTSLLCLLVAALLIPMIAAASWFKTLDWYPWMVLVVLGFLLDFPLERPLTWASERLNALTADCPERWKLGGFVWLAPPAWCLALGLCANAALDPSPAEDHPSEVISKGRKNDISLRDFRDGGQLQISFGLSQAPPLKEGQALTITTHAGLFGWPWIAAITPHP
jgi:hypothetical protein